MAAQCNVNWQKTSAYIYTEYLHYTTNYPTVYLSVALSCGSWHLWVKPEPPATLILTVSSPAVCPLAVTVFNIVCFTVFFPGHWHGYWHQKGYWRQRLMRGMPTLPHSNQELLVVRDKVGRLPGELGVRKSMECDIFPFSASTLLVGRQEGHPAC